jgi:hypothetical protein
VLIRGGKGGGAEVRRCGCAEVRRYGEARFGVEGRNKEIKSEIKEQKQIRSPISIDSFILGSGSIFGKVNEESKKGTHEVFLARVGLGTWPLKSNAQSKVKDICIRTGL